MKERFVEILIKAGVTWFPHNVAVNLIENGATIPVRCKDCVYCHINDYAAKKGVGSCRFFWKIVRHNDYCSFGERKDF